jgi:putative two-component system response regulator
MPEEVIMIVEDVDLLREGLREMLTVEGFRVLAARNGKEALEQIARNQPALIISDITMPVMNGYDFFSAVRSHPEWVGIPFIFLSARTDTADFVASRNLGVDDYLTKPISRDELVTTVRSRISRFRQAQMARVQQAYQDSLAALANAVESRSPSRIGHIERVVGVTLLIAEQLGWSANRLGELRFAAILHDIGKIHIPSSILFKQSPLTDAEWEIMRRHSVVGAEMLKDVPHLVECIPTVRHHHEHWDGSGYPDGLSGAAIPEGARILAIADSLDTMISPRPYKPEKSIEDACAEINALSGQRYDPEMTIILQKAFEDGKLQAILDSAKQEPDG